MRRRRPAACPGHGHQRSVHQLQEGGREPRAVSGARAVGVWALRGLALRDPRPSFLGGRAGTASLLPLWATVWDGWQSLRLSCWWVRPGGRLYQSYAYIGLIRCSGTVRLSRRMRGPVGDLAENSGSKQ